MTSGDKHNLMRRVMMAGFALDDCKLFLDTHPGDRAALEYFEKFSDAKKKLDEEYTNRFGPLRAEDADTSEKWSWLSEPWPWELEG